MECAAKYLTELGVYDRAWCMWQC